MATKRTTAKKKAPTKRALTRTEIKRMGEKYYSLKRYLYGLLSNDKISTYTKQYVKKAYSGLEKWYKDYVYIAQMTNYKYDSF